MRHSIVIAGLTVGIAVGLSLAGCGGGTDEAALVEAQDALREARTAVLTAGEALKSEEEALVSVQAEVEQARKELGRAQTELLRVEASVDLKATDGLLFRAIQRKLLDDPALIATAISVNVAKGVVTLSGEAPDGATQEVALEIASSVPGVASVVNKIVVSVAAPGDAG